MQILNRAFCSRPLRRQSEVLYRLSPLTAQLFEEYVSAVLSRSTFVRDFTHRKFFDSGSAFVSRKLGPA
jgi:hypothetical protein